MSSTETPSDARFAVLPTCRICWAVGAVHGRAETLAHLHKRLDRLIQPGDCLVYLGNLLGHSDAVAQAVDEALRFRRRVLAMPGMEPGDVVFLRGGQEEMWHRLLQIQFAANPGEVLDWMLAHGLAGTLAAYGGDAAQGRDAARRGAVALTDWTNRMRAQMRHHDGHVAFMSALKRGAYTQNNALLFVNAGLDPRRPLVEQTDSFWWSGNEFDAMTRPYAPFHRIVRGFDARRRGISIRPHAVSLDSGCGFSGSLSAMGFDADGEIVETVEVPD